MKQILLATYQFQLTMNDEELEANIAAVIAALCKHRNPALGKHT